MIKIKLRETRTLDISNLSIGDKIICIKDHQWGFEEVMLSSPYKAGKIYKVEDVKLLPTRGKEVLTIFTTYPGSTGVCFSVRPNYFVKYTE
jgi:hypothetical protein